MNNPRRKLDIVAMTSATYMAECSAQDVIRRAMEYQDDPARGLRIAANKCKACYYVRGGMAGAACTSQPCSGCGVVQHFGSTATDILCDGCASEHSLCKRCGGDRETRTLRRKWPTFDYTNTPAKGDDEEG